MPELDPHEPGSRNRAASLVLLVLTTALASPTAAQRIDYPPARRGDVFDTLHNVRVADPYRWLEDLNSAETAAWTEAQQRLTAGHLARLPAREAIRSRLTALVDYARVTLPTRLDNGVMFYRRNSGLQKQDVVLARSSPATPGRVVLDPNVLSPDGSVALSQYAPSPDARHLAYAMSEGGADWQTVKIRAVRSGEDLPEALEWVRFSSLSWTKDGKGFFYSRYPERPADQKLSAPLEHQKVYYHRIGTPQSSDVLIFERPAEPTWFVTADVTGDGRFLALYVSRGADSRNRLYVADLGDPRAPEVTATPRAIVDTDDGEFTVVGNAGTTLYVRTNLDAPRRKVVAIDLRSPERAKWRTVIAEGEHVIDHVALTSRHFVVSRLVDVKSELSLHALDGRLVSRLALPAIGSISGVSTSPATSSFFYAFTSPLYPTTIFRWDGTTQRSVPFEAPKLPFDPSRYETTQLFATSKDGTRVPLFVTHRKGLALDGTNPTLLYGYGGFAVSLLPSFSPAVVAWMEMGGVYASATLRGGGEYGEEWHRAGMKEKKQNVFDDFLAAAEHLVATRYTSPGKLAIEGGSNGGLLVGAAMTQRPELFALALPAVGVLDMLRYHKFTGGAAWATEYGSADDAPAFPHLLRYSPLHRVKPGTCYPATFITTADHDDRVVPSHSFKFAAALQAAQGCDNPVLIRIERQGSHGYRPTDKLIEEAADVWAFAADRLGMAAPAADR